MPYIMLPSPAFSLDASAGGSAEVSALKWSSALLCRPSTQLLRLSLHRGVRVGLCMLEGCSHMLRPSMQVKNKSLSTITKTLQYCPPAMLHGLLQDIPISAFIAALLASREPATLVVGVRLSELLMLKLPDVFTNMFLKEGAVHAMEQLSADAPSAPSSKAEKPKPKRTSTRLKVQNTSRQLTCTVTL